jgi:hypothetical protein
MVKWRLRSCPRCCGDMFIDWDLDGWYEECLQCSYRCELRDLDKVRQSLTYRDEELVRVP